MINRKQNLKRRHRMDSVRPGSTIQRYPSCHQIKNQNASVLEIYLFFVEFDFSNWNLFTEAARMTLEFQVGLKAERGVLVGNIVTETSIRMGITYRKGCSRLSATVADVFTPRHSLLESLIRFLFFLLLVLYADLHIFIMVIFLFAFQDFHVRTLFSSFFCCSFSPWNWFFFASIAFCQLNAINQVVDVIFT